MFQLSSKLALWAGKEYRVQGMVLDGKVQVRRGSTLVSADGCVSFRSIHGALQLIEAIVLEETLT